MLLLFPLFLSLIISSCGSDHSGSSKTQESSKSPGQVVVAGDPSQSGTVIIPAVPTAVSVAGVPDSYTMLDTPDANLCIDAFIRQGVTLPATTVARTLNVTNVRQNGISVQDMGSSTVPVLTILRLDNRCSDTTFQLLNPIGYYCIVKNDMNVSNVTLQRRCSAQIAEVEPATHVMVDKPFSGNRNWCFFGFCFGGSGIAADEATRTGLNSVFNETPCIP